MAGRKKRNKRARDHLMRAALKAPKWIHKISAGIHLTPEQRQAWKVKQLGKLGPASEVRHISIEQYIGEQWAKVAPHGTMVPRSEWDKYKRCLHCGQPITNIPDNYPRKGEPSCPSCGQIYFMGGIHRL